MFDRLKPLFVAAVLLAAQVATAHPAAPHQFFNVELVAPDAQPTHGRLLIFAKAAAAAEADALKDSKGKSAKVEEVDANPFAATSTSVAAREISRLLPGQIVALDGDEIAFPQPYSQLPPGDYYVQAVLDVEHRYNYRGRSAGNWVSEVVKLHLPASDVPTLRLVRLLPQRDPWSPQGATPEERKALDAARAHVRPIDFTSAALSAFWGRPVKLAGWVVTPPGYDAAGSRTYPTVYLTHGFGGTAAGLVSPAASVHAAMADGSMPPMIWVMLDQSSPTGTHEFADSVNNGPWGQALTAELIPFLESSYRMDAKPNGRFLTGHSSGGWATLWLQTRYPTLFGGTWSTSPDPADFHDFTGIDLYAAQANANVYRKPDGTPYPLVREQDKVLGTFEQFARLEQVLGSYGGQLASFDWVFSPRGADGRPQPMFDRDTGKVDPAVVAYWLEHFDIAHRLEHNWPTLKPSLDGKIHVIVGTADTFYLDGAAHKLQAVMDRLQAKSDFRFLPGKTHFDLYTRDQDKHALRNQISWEMYRVARPDAATGPAPK